ILKKDKPMGRPVQITFPSDLTAEADRFLSTMPYDPSAFLIDEILEVDAAAKRVRARLTTAKPLPLVAEQRGDPAIHPRHLAGPVLVQLTGMLGMVHAYFLHGVRF